MIGTHLLVDFYEAPAPNLCDAQALSAALVEAAARCRLTIVGGPHLHPFPGGGLTGFVMLAESHIAFHTYPEHGYCALDMFSCGKGDLDSALGAFREALNARRVRVRCIQRGDEMVAPFAPEDAAS
jgi:S-adenosylmethionine decarboxylase